jgi:hypothetical protein
MDAQEKPFKVAALRMGEVHGMVSTRPQNVKELCGLARITNGTEDDLREEIRIDRVGAGEGGKETSVPKTPCSLEVDFLVTPRRSGHILPGFCKGGRIEDDQIEGLLHLPKIIEDIGGHYGMLLRRKTVPDEVPVGDLIG